jgi:lincosamide nucleotidyltransferase A/C/D/E
MRGLEVVDVLHGLEARGIEATVEGGWGVDALVGRELRSHKDVDLIVNLADVEPLLRALEERGFVLVAGKPPNGFACTSASGSAVDVRPVTVEAGRAVFHGDNGDAFVYPPSALDGRGMIAGSAVRCLTAAAQMLTHRGYGYLDKDVVEVWLLHDLFGVPLPEEYAQTKRPSA